MSSIYGIVNKLNLSANDKMKEMSSEMLRWNPDNAGVYFSPSHVRYVNAVPVSVPEALNSKGIEAADAVSALFNEIPENSNVAMGCSMLWNTPESLHEFLPLYDNEAQLCLTADARIDNREELAAEFGYNWNDVSDKPDSWFILEAYKKWHNNCPKYLIGDFAFAIWNEKEQEMFAARDQIGIRPFAYGEIDEYFMFSSDMGLFRKVFPEIADNEEWTIDAFMRIQSEVEKSPFVGVFRLAPSHCLSLKDNKISINRYFEFNTTEKPFSENEGAVFAESKRLLEQAVLRRMRTIFNVGTELSGGLDSSAVTAFASKIANKKGCELHTFSHKLGDELIGKYYPFIDEREYIDIIVNHLNIKNHHYFDSMQVNINEFCEDIALTFRYLPQQTYFAFTHTFNKTILTANIRTVLSGFGGDQVFSHRGDWAYFEAIKRCNFLYVYKEIKNSNFNLKTIYQFSKTVYQYLKQQPSIFHLYCILNDKKIKNDLKLSGLNTVFFNKKDYKCRINNYNKLGNNSSLSNLTLSRLVRPYVSNRTETLNIDSEHNRRIYSFPLLDLSLLQFTLNQSYTIKYKNRTTRYLIRNTVSQILPSVIINRRSKTYAIVPSSFTLVSNLYHSSKFNNLLNNWLFRYIDIKYIRNNMNNSSISLKLPLTIVNTLILNNLTKPEQ